MPFPPPVERTPIHTRSVTYRAFHRSDGLWDIEAHLTDVKPYRFTSTGLTEVAPGVPVHDMTIRATVDDALGIREIAVDMPGRPFGECIAAAAPMQGLVGCTMGKGWRRTIDEHLGGVQGCTHLRELVFNMATAAFQSIPSYRAHAAREAGEPLHEPTTPPFHLGQCMSWDTDGPLVARVFPQFVGWKPVRVVK